MMGGELEQLGVEAHGVAHALEYGALEVVVEQDPCAPAIGDEGLGMAAQEAVHPGIEEEPQEDTPRVAQHHHEGHQRSACSADLQVTEMSPVNLGGLTRKGAQPQEGLGRWARAHAGNDMAEVLRAAAVAAFVDHREQPCGGERGELDQGREDEVAVRIDATGPQRRSRRGLAGLREHAPHGIAMHMQLAGDGAHAPAFGEVQAQDLCAQIGMDNQGVSFTDRDR